MSAQGGPPIFKHLRRRLHKVTRDACPVEARKLRAAQQTMKYMTHFMEECDDIIMTHQRWTFGRRFGEVCNHRSQRIQALAIGV